MFCVVLVDIKKLLERVKCGFPVSEGIGRLQVGWVLLLSGDLKQKFCSFNLRIVPNFVLVQIIKNSDLEELRELGSGTYGTVYHGKWRGTDVAIKRINDRCFTGKPSEQERMVHFVA